MATCSSTMDSTISKSLPLRQQTDGNRYGVNMCREHCDYDLTMLVAQCLCEDPEDRPSMKKLLEFTTYWLRHYSEMRIHIRLAEG